MTRELKTTKLGGVNRYRVIITDIDSNGTDKLRRQIEFLQDIVANGFVSGLLSCGPLPFETLKFYHNGQAWVAELEANEL
jgi:hypothetical protein